MFHLYNVWGKTRTGMCSEVLSLSLKLKYPYLTTCLFVFPKLGSIRIPIQWKESFIFTFILFKNICAARILFLTHLPSCSNGTNPSGLCQVRPPDHHWHLPASAALCGTGWQVSHPLLAKPKEGSEGFLPHTFIQHADRLCVSDKKSKPSLLHRRCSSDIPPFLSSASVDEGERVDVADVLPQGAQLDPSSADQPREMRSREPHEQDPGPGLRPRLRLGGKLQVGPPFRHSILSVSPVSG